MHSFVFLTFNLLPLVHLPHLLTLLNLNVAKIREREREREGKNKTYPLLLKKQYDRVKGEEDCKLK